MSKLIRRFLSLLLVLQLIIPYSTFAAAVGEFSSVVGNVTQTRAMSGSTETVTWTRNGNNFSASRNTPSCGTQTISGVVSGNSWTGSYSFSKGGSGTYSGTKQ
jgi:hypothetical protein